MQAGEKVVVDALKYWSPSLECHYIVDKGGVELFKDICEKLMF